MNKNDPKWQALYTAQGADLADAMQELYTVYDEKIIDWYANLYDPKIGGYYYSNSARDNDTVLFNGKEYKLLPDAEATFHSIGWWQGAGINGGITEWGMWLPEWMQKDVLNFIYNLQDEDGFFYHPQWGKDVGISRRARDLMWSLHMVNAFGMTPKYKTVHEAKKDDGSSKTLIPEHLRSEEAFAKYLEGLNIGERSYHSGNELAAQSSQIVSCGRIGQCIEFLNRTQHPETGHWHSKSNYYAVNGLFKLFFAYNAANIPFPNAMAAARSAIDAITSDEPMSAVTDLYNTWYTVANLLDNLRNHAGEEGNRLADGVVAELRELAPAAIRKSKEKILPFKKADGAFSYGPKSSSATSQGAPTAIPNSPEGDENATTIATNGLIGNIYRALELSDYRVPPFGDAERKRYITILEQNKFG